MSKKIVIALFAMMLPAVAATQDAGKFQCSFGEMQRRVEVVSEPGTAVPCSVHYYKDTEAPDEQQVLWTAQNDASYCAQKAEALVTKLEGWGWDCDRRSEPVTDAAEDVEDVEAVEELIDDTEELAPVEQPE